MSASVRVVATRGPGGGIPRIQILSPTPLEATGHGIYVSYRIENFTLVEPRGQPNALNEGHVQLLVESHVVMEVVQHEPVLLVSLPEGDITIEARLVNNDNTPLNPDASSSVPIHVVASSAVSLPLVSNGGVALLLAFILVVLVLITSAVGLIQRVIDLLGSHAPVLRVIEHIRGAMRTLELARQLLQRYPADPVAVANHDAARARLDAYARRDQVYSVMAKQLIERFDTGQLVP